MPDEGCLPPSGSPFYYPDGGEQYGRNYSNTDFRPGWKYTSLHLEALQGKNVQILHAADLEPFVLTLGDIEIFPEQRRVMKQGMEIHLNYGEFSILYCMARCPGRVFSRHHLYNAAWGED